MIEFNLDRSRWVDFRVRRGDTLDTTILVKNQSDNSDFDFTGHTVTFEVFTSISDLTANLTLAVNTATAGQLKLSKSASEMQKYRNRELIYRMIVIYPDATKHLWLMGKFIVQEQPADSPTTVQQINITAGDQLTIVIAAAVSGGGGGSVTVKRSIELDGGAIQLKNDINGPYQFNSVNYVAAYVMDIDGTRAWSHINPILPSFTRVAQLTSPLRWSVSWGGTALLANRKLSLGGGTIPVGTYVVTLSLTGNEDIYKRESLELYASVSAGTALQFAGLPGSASLLTYFVDNANNLPLTISADIITFLAAGSYKLRFERVKKVNDALNDNVDDYALTIRSVNAPTGKFYPDWTQTIYHESFLDGQTVTLNLAGKTHSQLHMLRIPSEGSWSLNFTNQPNGYCEVEVIVETNGHAFLSLNVAIDMIYVAAIDTGLGRTVFGSASSLDFEFSAAGFYCIRFKRLLGSSNTWHWAATAYPITDQNGA